MVICPKCGKENNDDALFCNKCGNSLTDKTSGSSSFEKQVEDFAAGVERVGEKAGKKIEQAAKRLGEETQDIGKRFEKATDRAGERLENWQDRTFGIFGPLVSSFIGIIVLRLVIEGLRIGAQDTPVLSIVSSNLLDYLLLIFVVFLVSSYSTYLYRKYKSYRWVSPIIVAVLIVVISTIVVSIASAVGKSTGEVDLIKAETQWRERYMFMIFVIIILVGYLINVATVAWEKDKERNM